MVTFFDPVTNQQLSYYISKMLRIKWDKIKDGKLSKLDEDRFYIVDGREGVGKSLFTFQQAKYLDPTFNIDRIAFSPEEFLNLVRTAPEGSVIVFDEAFRGLSSKASQSRINKAIVQAMMEMRQRHLIVFLVLPTFFLLEIYPATLRSNALFHLYKKKNGRRGFKIYNFTKKSKLYEWGRKKGFSYSRPKIIRSDEYYNIKPIDWKAYEEKKLKSLMEMNSNPKAEEESRYKRQRDNIIMKLLSQNGDNAEEVSRKLFAAGEPMSSTNIKRVRLRMEKELNGDTLNSSSPSVPVNIEIGVNNPTLPQ